MTTPIKPADLARYTHLGPVGATIPAGTKFVCEYVVFGEPDTFLIGPVSRTRDVTVSDSRYWTAEPLLTPEQARLETEYAAVCERIDAATAKIRELELQRETDDKEEERLYARLKKEGLR